MILFLNLIVSWNYKWIFENTDEAYLVLNNDNQIIFSNAKARLFLNLPTDSQSNENFMELVAKHYHQVLEPSKNPVQIDAKLIQLPRYIVRSDTETALPFWLRIDLMETSGESEEKYIVHLCNVTDTILANRQKWTFGGQINHKFRTPFIPILSGSEFILKSDSDIKFLITRNCLTRVKRHKSLAL